jgi:hypothetical protein
MDSKKKNMILIGVVVVLLVGALLLGFRETFFGGPAPMPAAELQAAMDESAKVADPVPAEPPKSNFSKTPKKLGGN